MTRDEPIKLSASEPGGTTPLPAELHAVDDRLSRLAGAERAAAGDSIEDRLFVRTRGLLPRSSRAVDVPAIVTRVHQSVPSFAARWRIAAAAGLAFVGIAGALMVSRGGWGATSGAERAIASVSDPVASQLEVVDARLALEKAWDGGLGDDLAALDKDLAALESGADSFWGSSGTADELDAGAAGGTGGSM